MVLSLFLREMPVRYFYHASVVLRSTMLRVSEDAVRFNFKAFWGREASFAILSSFSLSGISTREGIHIIDISLLKVDISSWMYRSNSLLE